MSYSIGILFYDKDSRLFSFGNKRNSRPRGNVYGVEEYFTSDLIYEVFMTSGMVYKAPVDKLVTRLKTNGMQSVSMLWDLYYLKKTESYVSV